jgi:hypothetical protein
MENISICRKLVRLKKAMVEETDLTNFIAVNVDIKVSI